MKLTIATYVNHYHTCSVCLCVRVRARVCVWLMSQVLYLHSDNALYRFTTAHFNTCIMMMLYYYAQVMCTVITSIGFMVLHCAQCKCDAMLLIYYP